MRYRLNLLPLQCCESSAAPAGAPATFLAPVPPVLRDSSALHTPIGQHITVPAPCSNVACSLPLLLLLPLPPSSLVLVAAFPPPPPPPKIPPHLPFLMRTALLLEVPLPRALAAALPPPPPPKPPPHLSFPPQARDGYARRGSRSISGQRGVVATDISECSVAG